MAQSLNVLPQLTYRPWQHCAEGGWTLPEDTALFPVRILALTWAFPILRRLAHTR